MPETIVYFYQEDDKSVPVFDWLKEIRVKDLKAYANCVKRIELLETFGHELRRPHADYLCDGIYELRIRCQKVHYQILYFFDGQDFIILAHALIKEKKVPVSDIERALERKTKYEQNPTHYRFEKWRK